MENFKQTLDGLSEKQYVAKQALDLTHDLGGKREGNVENPDNHGRPGRPSGRHSSYRRRTRGRHGRVWKFVVQRIELQYRHYGCQDGNHRWCSSCRNTHW
jgi:hypothetical protein